MCYCFHLPDVVRTLGAPLTLPSTPYSYTVLDQELNSLTWHQARRTQPNEAGTGIEIRPGPLLARLFH